MRVRSTARNRFALLLVSETQFYKTKKPEIQESDEFINCSGCVRACPDWPAKYWEASQSPLGSMRSDQQLAKSKKTHSLVHLGHRPPLCIIFYLPRVEPTTVKSDLANLLTGSKLSIR